MTFSETFIELCCPKITSIDDIFSFEKKTFFFSFKKCCFFLSENVEIRDVDPEAEIY